MFSNDEQDLALEVINLMTTPVAVFESPSGSENALRFVAGNRRFADIFDDSKPHNRRSIPRLLDSITRVVSSMSEPGKPESVVVSDETNSGYLRIVLQMQERVNNTNPKRIVAEFQRLDEDEADWQDLRSQVQQLQDLADNSTALMYVKNPQGEYTVVNRYFAKHFGRSPDEILGKTDHDLFDATSADVYQKHDRMVLESESAQEVEEPFSQIDGVTDPDADRRWLSIKFPLFDDSGVPYALGAISTDITARKRAESAATRAMHDAERANRSKNVFLSRMSHELRTPLNAILGFAELLKESDLDATRRENVAHILEAGQHLLTLINDVLDISWLESGAPGIITEYLPASVPIHEALEIIRPLAKRHDIEIASDLHGAIDVGLNADPIRLKQVFFNLLGNAIKFNRPHGAIRVSTKQLDTTLRYLVTDTGDGILPEEIGSLFAPFERLRNAVGIEGSGLGLALSRGLVEEMGGKMGVLHSAPGDGTTFFVDLPIVKRDAALALPAAELEDDPGTERLLQTATVVQIEDTRANKILLQRVLKQMGVDRLHNADSGTRGLELVKQVRPDIVFLDLNLHDISGAEVLRSLAEEEELKDIPVVILSADATPARIAELHSLGAFSYLTKPIDLRLLKSTLVNAIQARS